MSDQTEGVPDQPQGPWRRSTFCTGAGNHVEVAPAAGGVLVRDAGDPDGQTIHFTHSELHAFILGAKAGEFDDLIADPD